MQTKGKIGAMDVESLVVINESNKEEIDVAVIKREKRMRYGYLAPSINLTEEMQRISMN